MTLITHSISKYIEAKEKRKNVAMKIEKGKMLFWHHNRWINKKQFEVYYPIIEYKLVVPIK